MPTTFDDDFLPGHLLSAVEINKIKNNTVVQVDTVAELASVGVDVNVAYVVEDKSVYKRDAADASGWMKLSTSKELTDGLAGKANSSHGSHVPSGGTTNKLLRGNGSNGSQWSAAGTTSQYMRGDGTWQTKNWVASTGGTFTGAINVAGITGKDSIIRMNHRTYFSSGRGIYFAINSPVTGSKNNDVAFNWKAPYMYGYIDGGAANMIVGTQSDGKAKANIDEYQTEDGLSFVNDLNVVEYNPIDVLAEGYSAENRANYVADERLVGLVRQDAPDEIRVDPPQENDEEGNPLYGSVNYLGVVPYLISAVQDLSKQNKALEQRINELEGKE